MDEYVPNEMAVRLEIRSLLKTGIYHQEELFGLLYPHYDGHYADLREIIAEEKNYVK